MMNSDAWPGHTGQKLEQQSYGSGTGATVRSDAPLRNARSISSPSRAAGKSGSSAVVAPWRDFRTCDHRNVRVDLGKFG